MDNIRFIKPADLHAEMLRLYREEQMDFLKCLSGMDWGTRRWRCTGCSTRTGCCLPAGIHRYR